MDTLPARWRALTTTQADGLQLVVCPFAGASGSAFSTWRNASRLDLSASLVVYPGHDHRMRETLRRNVADLAQEVAADIMSLPEAQRRRILLAGHSMGAQVAFEASLLLEASGLPLKGLILSGCQAPHLPSRRLLSQLHDEAFIRQLAVIGGCSPDLLRNADLVEMFLPILRADFEATETYLKPLAADNCRNHVPTLLLAGTDDTEADLDEVTAWRHWIAGPVMVRQMAGDHFYPVTRPTAFCRHVIDFHRQWVA